VAELLPAPPHERRWPATLTVLVVLVLQFALPQQMGGWLRWALPAIEVALLIPLIVTNPLRLRRDSPQLRMAAVALTVVMATANAISLLWLVVQLLHHQWDDPTLLVKAGVLIWMTNVAAVAVGLWELDRGGPFARDPRHHRDPDRPDLLFPQMTGVPGWDANRWRPGFADYLFVAFTSATAFSPTDTLPLSVRGKLLMSLAGGVSLVTIGVLLARAVNVL
jgi:branched-subunit amino acid transport protein